MSEAQNFIFTLLTECRASTASERIKCLTFFLDLTPDVAQQGLLFVDPYSTLQPINSDSRFLTYLLTCSGEVVMLDWH